MMNMICREERGIKDQNRVLERFCGVPIVLTLGAPRFSEANRRISRWNIQSLCRDFHCFYAVRVAWVGCRIGWVAVCLGERLPRTVGKANVGGLMT